MMTLMPMLPLEGKNVFVASLLSHLFPQIENVSMQDSMALRRVRQIGEYVTLLDEISDYSDYATDHRSILMYNEEIDKMTRITIQVCLQNSGLFDADGELRPLDYDSASTVNRRDLDDDFLTFLSPGPDGKTRRAPCEYLFDIAPEYLNIKKVIAGGQTLKRAIEKKYSNVASIAELFAAENVAEPIAVPARVISFVNALVGVVGRNALFATGVNNADMAFGWLADGSVAPVVPAGFDQGAGVTISSKVDESFVKLAAHYVPAAKKDEIAHIVNGNEPTLRKTEQIRDKIIEYVQANVPGMKLKTTDEVHTWYDKSVATYRQKLAEEQRNAAPTTAAPIAGYMKRGMDLTGTQYRYKYAESARTPQEGVDALLPVHLARCERAASAGSATQSSRLHATGEGMGFAGIGQFATDSFQQRRDRNDGFNDNRYVTFAKHNDLLNRSGASEVEKLFARAFLMTRITLPNMLQLADHDVVTPFNFLLARPHMQYATLGLIKCAQNGKTGITPIGHSNFVIAHEAGRKLTQFHYTTHYRCVVLYPKNLNVQPDVMVQECEGGAGCRFYDVDSYNAMNNDKLVNSLICIALPITETIFPNPMDLSGRFYTDFGTGAIPRLHTERLHYSTAARYNAMYNFLRGNKAGSDVPHMDGARNHLNRIMYQGHQQNWSTGTKSYSKVTTNKGHWFDNATYAGARPIRNGSLDQFKSNPDYSNPGY